MTTVEHELIQLVLRLPPTIQREVRNFAEFLLDKQQNTSKQTLASNKAAKLNQDWAGAIQHMNQVYDSVTLQHQASS